MGSNSQKVYHQVEVISPSTIKSSVIPFVSESIKNKRKVLIITNAQQKNLIHSELTKPEVKISSKKMVKFVSFFHAEDLYLLYGKIDPQHLLKQLVEFKKSFQDQGFDGMNIIGDASFLHHYPELQQEFIEYESLVDRLLFENEIYALCLYHKSMEAQFLQTIITSHYAVRLEGETYLYDTKRILDSTILASLSLESTDLIKQLAQPLQFKDLDPSKLTIVVLDDHKEIRNLYLTIFKDKSFNIITTSSGEQLLELFIDLFNLNQLPDLLICDQIIHKGMNGDEVTGILRSYGIKIPILLSSSTTYSDVCKNYRDYGFDDFLEKPFRSSELFETIQSLLKLPNMS